MSDEEPKRAFKFKDIAWRMNPVRKNVLRYKTGITAFDEWVGGLPYGLTVIYGEPGSGKSLLAREIAKHAEYALYLTCEVVTDSPPHSKFPNVDTVDYTRYLPNYQKAIEELDCFIDEKSPDLVVIDSLTSFLSVTRKALPESDIREGVARIHTRYEGELPIIGISEIRGTGFSRSTAGGVGVKHGCCMLIDMNHVFADNASTAESYGVGLGEDVYSLQVEKDKHGLSRHDRSQVIFKDGELTFIPVKKIRTERKEKKYWHDAEGK